MLMFARVVDVGKEIGPVALIRPYRPPSPAKREKRFIAIAARLSGSPGGSPSMVAIMLMFARVVDVGKEIGPVALIRPYRPPSPTDGRS